MGTSLSGAKIAVFNQYMALASTAGQGRSDGGISVYIYIPPEISNRFVHVWGDINTCFEIAMTS